MSPDTVSLYPDRPIRPLPKKPLRERLSPEVASTIKYPPAPKTTTPLFQYGYSRDENSGNGLVEPSHPSERERADEFQRNYISRRNGDDLESDEDDQAYRSRIYSRPSADTPGRSYRYVQRVDSKNAKPQPPASTASSADGYDSFENTNNKKKRKIPTPGDTLNGTHLSGDLAVMGISGPEDLSEDVSPGNVYHVSGSGQGLSGPGRGRYGRVRNGRSPLRTLSDASANWGNGRTSKRQPQWPSTNETAGIISQSIATAEKYPITPSRGQENVSILHQASKKSSPASTQFTFTCDSQVPAPAPWPLPSNSGINQSQVGSRMMSTHGTQTSPSMPAGYNPPSTQSRPPHGPMPKQPPPPPITKKTRRRRTGNEYLAAARQRREAQRWKNQHQPVSKEEQWICEFCEYEQIFGEPPMALIRQYEIKDRRQRKQEAERQRLLEKAKKNRKGKKGGKTASKAVASQHDKHTQQSQHHTSMNQTHSQGTQSDEQYDNQDDYDEEDEEYEAPPSPAGARAT
ncbi:hypothetical protein B0O99DRAFT_520857 [Bisporella sp. PMI_857]|nr:hypothetical protein B0O99DRAFT_520857 [Bisporella sp. PMI_857]